VVKYIFDTHLFILHPFPPHDDLGAGFILKVNFMKNLTKKSKFKKWSFKQYQDHAEGK